MGRYTSLVLLCLSRRVILEKVEQELLDHIQSVDSQVRGDPSLRLALSRFGNMGIGVSWLNDVGYCEYKLEFSLRRDGVPVAAVVDSLPSSPERDTEIRNLEQANRRMSSGTQEHEEIANRLEQAGRRSEVSVSAPFLGTTLLGRMDLPSISDGAVYVVDWKTGAVPKPGDAWAGDVLQILGYCYVMRYIMDLSPVFCGYPLVGCLYYTRAKQTHAIDYDSPDSVVRPGFCQFRVWSDCSPAELAEEKLMRLWMYLTGGQEAVPAGACTRGNRDGKSKNCEYRAVCVHSPYYQLD